ncbi:MAG: hypothetical protein AAFO77_13250 [Pseudomonadota bacterium]
MVGKLLTQLRDLLFRKLAFHSEPHAVRLGACHAFGGALSDKLALEFADCGQHMKHQASRRAGCIDLLVEHDEMDSLLFDLAHQFRQVGDRTGEPVEARHQELISFAHEVERSVQCLALRLRAAGLLLLENLFDSDRFELGDLCCKVLPRRRDAGISNLHVPKSLRGYGTPYGTHRTQEIDECKSVFRKP